MRRAFTLVELMVAIAVTVVMLLAINKIFTTAMDAVGTGTGISRIIEDSRAIGEQMSRDAGKPGQEKMIGPESSNTEDGAYLLIVQHHIDMAGWPNNRVPPNAQNQDGVYVSERDRELGSTVPVRSDQLLFYRDWEQGMEPLAPDGHNSYSNSTDAGKVRIWYGHALRTAPNGIPDANNDGNLDFLGEPGTPNALAKNWVLGRQALFLTDTVPPLSFRGSWVTAELERWDPSASNYASTVPSTFPNPVQMYTGLHDVALQTLHGRVGSGASSVPGIISGSGNNDLDSNNYAWDDPNNNHDDVHDYLFTRGRLWVNPQPDDNHFRPWQIGQMHPFMTGHVSDFVVEFAGDYAPKDGEIDLTQPVNQPATGALTDINGREYRYDGGEIKWYSHRAPTGIGANVRVIENEPGRTDDNRYTTVYVNNPQADGPPSSGGNYDSKKPTVFPMPNGTYDTTVSGGPPWRTTYNADPSSGGGAAPQHATASFLWVNMDDGDANGRNWPWLIRIRYRIHDPEGRVIGKNDRSGKWFEQIIPVPRP